MPHDLLSAQLADFGERYPEHASDVADFSSLLADPLNPFVRDRFAGHFTASCWLVNAAGTDVLLTHHRKLQRWLQLGGHADGETDLRIAALAEASEESGLSDLVVEGGIFDLDRHTIPARGSEPEHDHYDVRFVIRALGDTTPVVSEESLDLAWRPIAAIASDPSADVSMRRMALRWLALQDER